MEQLDAAMDDLDGLLELFRVLADEGRASRLGLSRDEIRALQREVAGAIDVYATSVMASARGDVDDKRLKAFRSAAQHAMPGAVAIQRQLGDLVQQERLQAQDIRADLQQLLTLSLQCRSAVAALAPTVDRRAAEALANKVLVGLREATLHYLAAARDSGTPTPEKPRTSAVGALEQAERHAAELAALAPPAEDENASLGALLSKQVDEMMRKTAQAWSLATPSESP
jgi:hypothetical protein